MRVNKIRQRKVNKKKKSTTTIRVYVVVKKTVPLKLCMTKRRRVLNKPNLNETQHTRTRYMTSLVLCAMRSTPCRAL